MTWDIVINSKHCEFVWSKGCSENNNLVEFCVHADNLYGPCCEADCPLEKDCQSNGVKMHYKPLEILKHEVHGIAWAMGAMRIPKKSTGDTSLTGIPGPKDLQLASNLVKSGDDHAKAMRGIVVWVEIRFQVGWLIEFETYRHGVECLSTSSSMHSELKSLKGSALAEQKQADLPDKVYTRILTISYQALRSMYKARRNHRHPDWHIMTSFIETLPYFDELIYPERGAK